MNTAAVKMTSTYRPFFVGKLMIKDGNTIAEDQLWIDEKKYIAAIVDGVSSQLGAAASRKAIKYLAQILASKSDTSMAKTLMSLMNEPLLMENREIVAAFSPTPQKPDYKVLLASALILSIKDNIANFSHLGDSRLMLLRDEVLHNLTRDHSLLQDKIQQGSISKDERWMIESPLRHVLTRCLGEWQEDIPSGTLALNENDILLMCSDGLTHMLLHSEISALMNGYRQKIAQNPKDGTTQLMELLLKKIKQRGVSDDVSIIIVCNLDKLSTSDV